MLYLGCTKDACAAKLIHVAVETGPASPSSSLGAETRSLVNVRFAPVPVVEVWEGAPSVVMHELDEFCCVGIR